MVNMAPNEVEKRRSNGERSTVEDDGGALARTILECLCGTDAEKGKNATISDREDAVAETWHPGSEAFRSRSPNLGVSVIAAAHRAAGRSRRTLLRGVWRSERQ